MPSSFIERLPAARGNRGAPMDGELARAIARWKRLGRQGWSIEVLHELKTGDVIALGWRNFAGAELEPDRVGQFELDVGGV